MSELEAYDRSVSEASPVVGEAYRSSYDGVVRWCIARSGNDGYRFLWFEEDREMWHEAGWHSRDRITAQMLAEPAACPASGTVIEKLNAQGRSDMVLVINNGPRVDFYLT